MVESFFRFCGEMSRGEVRIYRAAIVSMGLSLWVGFPASSTMGQNAFVAARGMTGGDGQSQSGGITVNGSGQVLARPNLLEIPIIVSASAELSDDAVTKYGDAREQVMDAFAGLGLENFSSLAEGIELNMGNSAEMMNMAMRGQAPDATAKQPVLASSRLWLRVSGIEEAPFEEILSLASRLIDTAKDAGAQIGPSSADASMAYRYGRQMNNQLVRYVLEDLDDVREEAYQRAMDDARQRAGRLSRLGDLNLGGVRNVVETFVSDQQPVSQNIQPWQQVGASVNAQTKPRVVANKFDDIPFVVRLAVSFEVFPKDETNVEEPATAE